MTNVRDISLFSLQPGRLGNLIGIRATIDDFRDRFAEFMLDVAQPFRTAAILDHVNAARTAEQQAADAAEASTRQLERIVLAGAGIVGLAVLAAIVLLTPRPVSEPRPLLSERSRFQSVRLGRARNGWWPSTSHALEAEDRPSMSERPISITCARTSSRKPGTIATPSRT